MRFLLFLAVLLTTISAAWSDAQKLYLDDMDYRQMQQSWGQPQAGKSVDGRPMRIADNAYDKGIGTHAVSEVTILLYGKASVFHAFVGLDDEAVDPGSVVFEVWGDNKMLGKSPIMRKGNAPHEFNIDISHKKSITLIVKDADDGINNDHADWADAWISYDGKKPEMKHAPEQPAPKIAHIVPGKPRINGASVVGCTPGNDFIYLIPATAACKITYSAKDLPDGLSLDSQTGVITGKIQKYGTYTVTVSVKGKLGSATRKLKIIAGDHKLAQTPPMGWNSWNCFAGIVDDEKVRATADRFISKGLAAHGYNYINIDDCWQGNPVGRDASGNVISNDRFPDMKALCDYVHSKGLKIGIYSSPGPKTCAGYEGSYQHEVQDAKRWADWGFDYIKYDWCSYGSIAKNSSLEELQKPYRVMREALDQAGRDIIYSFCQYGMGDVWKWGTEFGGNVWRTTGDITDNWASMSSIGFSQDGHEKYASPGHWNDPDMLVVGVVGWGNLHPTGLTKHEQITHMTLWCMLSSPLLIGCDLTKLDSFTLDILTNDEVLAINQDPLGKPAGKISAVNEGEVWARPLADGTTAIALFNRASRPMTVTANFAACGIKGKQPVRDLWRQKDLGEKSGKFSAKIASHGAVLIKVGTPR